MRATANILLSLAAAAFIVGTRCAAAEPAAPPVSFSVVQGHLKVGFDQLASFPFDTPDASAEPASAAALEGAIPARIKALDGKQVMVTGYMLPVKMDGDQTTEFLLVVSPMLCCYGMVPRMNEWILVRMAKGGSQVVMDTPIQFFGRLHVKPVAENGMMIGIYFLDGEKMGDGQG